MIRIVKTNKIVRVEMGLSGWIHTIRAKIIFLTKEKGVYNLPSADQADDYSRSPAKPGI